MLKIVIAGAFAVGKTTLVGAVSEISPLTTDEILTAAGSEVDHLAGVDGKTTTTVSMDFGRLTLEAPQPIQLFLFGTPGQDRFLFTWDDLSEGAVGAVVLADTRRLADSFVAVDFFEERGMPFVVALNQFDGAPVHSIADVRDAFALPEAVPILHCDARDTRSAAAVLITLVRTALAAARSHAPTPGAHL